VLHLETALLYHFFLDRRSGVNFRFFLELQEAEATHGGSDGRGIESIPGGAAEQLLPARCPLPSPLSTLVSFSPLFILAATPLQ
jgi:hypothetical protein